MSNLIAITITPMFGTERVRTYTVSDTSNTGLGILGFFQDPLVNPSAFRSAISEIADEITVNTIGNVIRVTLVTMDANNQWPAIEQAILSALRNPAVVSAEPVIGAEDKHHNNLIPQIEADDESRRIHDILFPQRTENLVKKNLNDY